MQEDNNKIQECIQWHHTRWFWGVVISGLNVVSVFVFYSESSFLLGPLFIQGLPGYIISSIIFGSMDSTGNIGIFFQVLYMLIPLLWLYQTFREKKVQIHYPLRYLVNLAVSWALFLIIMNINIASL